MATSKRQKLASVVSTSDRLSWLPNSVVSNILSLLPAADAFASRRLCRRWFAAWASDSVLDFSGIENGSFVHHDEFFTFVDGTLSRLDDHGLVQKLKLCWKNDKRVLDRLENWLTALVKERGLRELEIDGVTILSRYILPRSILISSRALTSLTLKNLLMTVNEGSSLSLDSVTTLSLTCIKSDEDSLNRLISSSPCLESLEIRWCFEFKSLRVRSPIIKSFEFQPYPCSSHVQLEHSKSLKSLGLTTLYWFADDDSLGELENLTSLRLDLWTLTGSVMGRIAKMKRLETLVLKWRSKGEWLYHGGRCEKICGQNLRNLVLEGDFWLIDVVIVDAPNLETFSYDKDLVSVSILNSPKLKIPFSFD